MQPSSTRATSFTSTCAPVSGFVRTTMFSNSSFVLRRPFTFSLKLRYLFAYSPPTVPAAAWMFWLSIALLISAMEMLRPASLIGSSQMRIAYVRPPVSTSATPSMRAMPSATCFSTKFERSMRSISRPSVMNMYMTMRSSGLLRTTMPFCVTSLGSFGSARFTAFCTFTRAMLEGVPGRKIT